MLQERVVLWSAFFSTAGFQTVVLGTKFISLGFDPFYRAWPLQTVNFERDVDFFFVFAANPNFLTLLQQL